MTYTSSEHDSLWQLLRDKAFREQLVAEQVKRSIPHQVNRLLQKRCLNQTEFAARAGLTQGAVSRAANLNYGNLTLSTIVRLAAGFDVAFVGAFVPFSKLVEHFDNLDRLSDVATFEEEDAAIVQGATQYTDASCGLSETPETSDTTDTTGQMLSDATGSGQSTPTKFERLNEIDTAVTRMTLSKYGKEEWPLAGVM